MSFQVLQGLNFLSKEDGSPFKSALERASILNLCVIRDCHPHANRVVLMLPRSGHVALINIISFQTFNTQIEVQPLRLFELEVEQLLRGLF